MADDYVYVVYRVDFYGLENLPERARKFEEEEARQLEECMEASRAQVQEEGESFGEEFARETCERDKRWRDNPWDTLVKIKEVFTDSEHAEQEVARLNKLNADKQCRYFWQGARFYPEGRKTQRQTQDTD